MNRKKQNPEQCRLREIESLEVRRETTQSVADKKKQF